MITRIAPSPTGVFHLGTARTAYFNWLAARSTHGKFILRIDDTDNDRNIAGSEQMILDSLDWLGLTPDIVFKQSDTFQRCLDVANGLINSGHAIYDGDAIILKNTKHYSSWHDEVIGNITVSDDDRRIASSIVLIKSDKTPTYIFSSVVNDYDYGVDMIIRGVDHISNTLRQIILFDLCNTRPKFAHIGLLRNKNKKLSKRDNPLSVLDYKEHGYSPDALLSFLLRNGWSHKNPNYNSPINKIDAIHMFWQDGHLNAKCSNLDFNRLDWIQRKFYGGLSNQ